MENTSPFLFDNSDEKYFLAIRGRAVGPLTAQEVYERIKSGEAGLLHYLWREGWREWKRVCEARDFMVLVPSKPSARSITAIREKMAGDPKYRRGAHSPPGTADLGDRSEQDAETYYLYFSRTQYGPFSRKELIHVLKTHDLDKGAYLWKAGWANWKSLREVTEFAKTAHKHTKGTPERRKGPRRPLVARLFLHNDQDVIIAVCRDISIGGMQVLTDRVPGPVGSCLKLNVSPGDPGRVQGFVAEGEIVRVLEDGRGFSFRFKRISDEARQAIESYIASEQ